MKENCFWASHIFFQPLTFVQCFSKSGYVFGERLRSMLPSSFETKMFLNAKFWVLDRRWSSQNYVAKGYKSWRPAKKLCWHHLWHWKTYAGFESKEDILPERELVTMEKDVLPRNIWAEARLESSTATPFIQHIPRNVKGHGGGHLLQLERGLRKRTEGDVLQEANFIGNHIFYKVKDEEGDQNGWKRYYPHLKIVKKWSAQSVNILQLRHLTFSDYFLVLKPIKISYLMHRHQRSV